MSKAKRNLWPVSIVAFFVVAIIFSAVFVTIAVRHRDDLVSVDYYEREVRFQKQLDTINRTQAVAAQAVVKFELKDQAIVIVLPETYTAGATGNIHLYRPSDAQLDRDLPLALAADGTQRVGTQKLAEGLWKVRVNWSSNGQDYFLDQPVLVAKD